ncbi:class I SAM-dependent methyltransferase [Streptomyces sp. NPDC001606]
MADAPGFQLKGSAPERYETYVAPLMAPFVTALLDAADLNPGDTVLDLACGTGFAARAAAALTGPAGRVYGIDINEGMVSVARERHPRLYPDIEFAVAAADRLPYPDATFDTVVCQQAAQFFPDLTAALTETARVTRPQGRFAATVWAALDDQPYFRALGRAIEEYGGPEAAKTFAHAFACTAEQLTTALGTAGYRSTEQRQITLDITLPPLDDYVAGHLSATSWSTRITEPGGEEALTRAARLIRDELAPYTADDGTATLPFTVVLVTAVR